MANTTTTTLVVSILLLSMLLRAALSTQEGPAAAPAMLPEAPPDCTSALLNVSSCLTYVEEGSKTKSPEKGCCSGLAGLVSSSPVCLCQLLGGGASAYGLQIDTARAMALPAACKVDTPPVSLCSVFGIPVASPSPLTPSPVSGGPGAPGSSMELGTPAASPPPSANRGSRSFSDVVVVLYAGILVIVFF